MRFPLALTTKIAAYIIGHKLRGTKKFATVLQLEPLHTCNLTCTGCGRIREYSTSLKDMMSSEDCFAAAEECNAPMVSICGGEPLIYPHIEALVNGLLAQNRIVYICTNAMFMRKKMRDWMASQIGKRREFVDQKFDYLSDLGVDGHTISPGYDYDAAKKDMTKRLNLRPEDFFLTRSMTIRKFRKVEKWMNRYTFFGTPVYFEFLAGKRDLTCSAWAIPTRNIRGWKGPCYLMTDGHYSSYAELLEKTEWDKYGVVNGIARDSRCENCMVHCGYEPTASLGLQAQRGDAWKTIKFNFGPKPKPTGRGSETIVFNGISSGNGHITGKSAQANGTAARAS